MMEELGRKMVAKCSGLPLAIVILGGILVTKPSVIEWEKVYADSLTSLKGGKGLGENHQRELFYVLLWSCNCLLPQLKLCFLYLGKFGEDKWIKTETLYQLWIAEGMVLSSDKREGETMMQVAESYMGELVHKSMVQVRVNNEGSSLGKFKSFCLHDVMRDLALSQAQAEDFFHVINFDEENAFQLNPSAYSLFASTRQLVVHFREDRIDNTSSIFLKRTNHEPYRSMLLFNQHNHISLSPVLGSHIANYKLLRVFAMENIPCKSQLMMGTVFNIKLGRVLGTLVHLRYLSVRNGNLSIFPSIQNLILLQTFKIDTLESIYSPPSLSTNVLDKLGYLRHLYLPNGEFLSKLKIFKLRLGGLSKLETLVNFRTDLCEVNDLPKLINLQKLKLRSISKYDDLEKIMKHLTGLVLSTSSCLQRLDISIFIDDLKSQNGSDILRKLMCDHKFSLRKLYIRGKLIELAELLDQEQHQQLHNTRLDATSIRLTRLSLSFSHLEKDPMPVLETVPTLKELFLLDAAFVGKEMVISSRGFQKLTHLDLWQLPNFVIWKVEEGSMPFLVHLTILCPIFVEVPEHLKSILSSCEEEMFVTS